MQSDVFTQKIPLDGRDLGAAIANACTIQAARNPGPRRLAAVLPVDISGDTVEVILVFELAQQ